MARSKKTSKTKNAGKGNKLQLHKETLRDLGAKGSDKVKAGAARATFLLTGCRECGTGEGCR